MQKIITKTVFFAIDILLLLFNVIRQIVLPNRKRKGNILSSIFLFFILLAEKMIAFEKSLLQQPWLLKSRYIKRGLILTSIFLFLVSSFEWKINQVEAQAFRGTPATIIKEQLNTTNTFLHNTSYLWSPAGNTAVGESAKDNGSIDNNCRKLRTHLISKRYLRYNVLLI
ncbi:MAG TPA: hypothetical protein VG738_19515 [Chitinophagaceae bacterium]|nr:hypothetical protein [Chitinophagaceae bacterium]